MHRISLAFATLILAFVPVVQARTMMTEGFIEIRPGVKLYYTYKPAEPGYDTLQLVNGLTYGTRNWDKFVNYFKDKPYGIIRSDMVGMERTLIETGRFVRERIPIEQQADDQLLLKEALGVKSPVVPVGLSYGGGVTVQYAIRHPEAIKKFVLMAPYTGPIKNHVKMIKSWMTWYRTANPFDPVSDNDLFNRGLWMLVSFVFPLAERSMYSHYLKPSGIHHMIDGAMHSLAEQLVSKLPPNSMHLIKAGKDDYLDKNSCENLWAATPLPAQASFMEIMGSHHKIPEHFPEFAAAWVEKILENDKRISDGRKFIGEPRKGRAVSGDVSIEMPTEYPNVIF